MYLKLARTKPIFCCCHCSGPTADIFNAGTWKFLCDELSSLFVFQCGWVSCFLCWEWSPYLLMPLHIWRDFSCKSFFSPLGNVKYNSNRLFMSQCCIFKLNYTLILKFVLNILFPDFMQTWQRDLASWALKSSFLYWILPSCPRMPCQQGRCNLMQTLLYYCNTAWPHSAGISRRWEWMVENLAWMLNYKLYLM